MNPLQDLEKRLRASLPGHRVELLEPMLPDGTWWLDVWSDGAMRLAVAWRASEGFGVSSTDDYCVLGRGHDETYDDIETAERRVTELLVTGARTLARRIPERRPAPERTGPAMARIA